MSSTPGTAARQPEQHDPDRTEREADDSRDRCRAERIPLREGIDHCLHDETRLEWRLLPNATPQARP
jgi:hypothetical protein